jgi:hypothetical protein
MNTYPLIADAAWLRLGIVALDIIAVVVTVRICSAVGTWSRAWWRAQHSPGRALIHAHALRRTPARQ